jgi:glutamyl-Q tRNA(Asp) synthetase
LQPCLGGARILANVAGVNKLVSRFAPSPTGKLHLGSAFSALLAYDMARARHGRFLLRIEDIDRVRCRPEFTTAIFEDLAWLGLTWEQPVRVQSEHFDDYRAGLQRLEAMGLIYPCFCTRADIAREIHAAASAPHGPDGALYPGTCRHLDGAERKRRMAREAYALRLDVAKAVAKTGPLSWSDELIGSIAANPVSMGDVVLARKDFPAAYHLSVTIDDHLQGITLVVRGQDLFHSTHIHRLLQALLGYATPLYHHHRLLLDKEGKRLAKRERATTIASLREDGVSPAEIRARIGLPAAA